MRDFVRVDIPECCQVTWFDRAEVQIVTVSGRNLQVWLRGGGQWACTLEGDHAARDAARRLRGESAEAAPDAPPA